MYLWKNKISENVIIGKRQSEELIKHSRIFLKKNLISSKCLTQLRISPHTLSIEQGRYRNCKERQHIILFSGLLYMIPYNFCIYNIYVINALHGQMIGVLQYIMFYK